MFELVKTKILHHKRLNAKKKFTPGLLLFSLKNEILSQIDCDAAVPAGIGGIGREDTRSGVPSSDSRGIVNRAHDLQQARALVICLLRAHALPVAVVRGVIEVIELESRQCVRSPYPSLAVSHFIIQVFRLTHL
ncbi:hypothetical protein Elgi_67280 [Paenibacillus elgii]|uniref:hypothetical protein n=1 Tax=Paenibacillus elgii TaxID=189691 RepID=UPI002D7B27F8|nr:hypothetical protein Elgi_67280 [Paenibacillus elgii]